MQAPQRSKLIVALLCIALGSVLVLVACGIIEDDPTKRHAPDFIIALSGSVFVIAGIMMLVGRKSRVNDLLAAILCMTFGITSSSSFHQNMLLALKTGATNGARAFARQFL